VIGFAAETENLIDNAKAKLARKGCDWIVANDVSPASGVMGGDRNTVHLLTRDADGINVDSWPAMTKEEVATTLVAHVAKALTGKALTGKASTIEASTTEASTTKAGENPS
jgi:phosphopantothenoylcysteine decarboxylase/phosphopantothenate--cysteine ligase